MNFKRLFSIFSDDKNRMDFSKDFFARPAHLTVSGQLDVETYAFAFRNKIRI